MTIEYFINQLRMKYLMRVKKSNEKEDDDNYIYFASQCRDVHKEIDSWHIFYERLWMEISHTFVMKWMAQPFPAINKKIKSQKFEKFSKVEKEDWNKNRNKIYKWFKMTNGMRKQYQVMNRKDSWTLVESYCPVKYKKYHQR